jgi:uncharacterized protein YjdB
VPVISAGETVDAGVLAVVIAKASRLTNPVNIADSDVPIAYTVGNTNVLTVSTNGLVTGRSAGSTTIIATVGANSSTQSVTVIAVPTTVRHRYSFSANANDSIGGR